MWGGGGVVFCSGEQQEDFNTNGGGMGWNGQRQILNKDSTKLTLMTCHHSILCQAAAARATTVKARGPM